MTTTTTTAPLTYTSPTGDVIPVRRVRLEVSVEMYAYVPVDYQPHVAGTELRDTLESDLRDAIKYHGGYLVDFEPGDALLITDDVSVGVNELEDAEPDPDADTKTLDEWVGAISAGA